jgi:flavin reductase (DIM6/NTAB) family NADH-FMN oxidoreductase RutF
MEHEFIPIQPEAMDENVFHLVGDDWMFITAGTLEKFNAMTASWGGFGVLWQKNICFCVIRPQRYTLEFVENNANFSLSFFSGAYREVLNFFGAHSGRDVDKMKGQGLTPLAGRDKTVHFKEAKLYLECRKIYFQDLVPENFIDSAIAYFYPEKDYHRMFVAEITGCYAKKS